MKRSSVRLAFRLLSLSLSLLALNSTAAAQTPPPQLAGPASLGAGPLAGWTAAGEATVTSSRGTETGAVTIAAWGASHCRVTLDLSIPGENRRYEAVLDGPRVHVAGPQDLTSVLVAPAWREGCALLPQGLLLAELGAGKAVLSRSADGSLLLDRAAGLAKAPELALNPSGLPQSLSWQDKRGDPVVVSYDDYQAGPGAAYPATVTETVAGRTRLEIRLTSFSAHPGFSNGDFPVPSMPPPRHAAAAMGGAQ